jgi:hypothetical protein
MQTWYECKVKYLKIDQGGFERKVNDNYLIDAISFTDAETRIFEQMHQITRGEFQVVNIKRSNITEILPFENGEWWYKAKISLVTIDEEAGKEKKVNQYILIMADELKEALTRLEKGLEYMLVPYAVTSIQLSTIADVFPYHPEDAVKPQSTKEVAAAKVEEEEEEPLFEMDNDELEPIEPEDE